MFNFTDCFNLLTPEQQMNFHYEFKRLRGEGVFEKEYAYLSFDHPKEIISCAFPWKETTQGVDYWIKVYRELYSVMDMFEYSPSNN